MLLQLINSTSLQQTFVINFSNFDLEYNQALLGPVLKGNAEEFAYTVHQLVSSDIKKDDLVIFQIKRKHVLLLFHLDLFKRQARALITKHYFN